MSQRFHVAPLHLDLPLAATMTTLLCVQSSFLQLRDRTRELSWSKKWAGPTAGSDRLVRIDSHRAIVHSHGLGKPESAINVAGCAASGTQISIRPALQRKSPNSIRGVAITTRRRYRVAITSRPQLAHALITIAVNSCSPPHGSTHA